MTGFPLLSLRAIPAIWRRGGRGAVRRSAYALALLLAAPAVAQDLPGAAERGAAIAERWCSQCHTATTSGTDAVPSLGMAARRWDDEALRGFLSKPHGEMPDLNLEVQAIDDLIAFMRGLRE